MKTLTVFEKYSKHWPAITIISAVLTLLMFGAYWYSDDVLIAGYLRLGAFCFFALSLLSFFKWMDGRIKIDFILHPDKTLTLDYHVRNQKIASDHFDLSKFGNVEMQQMPNKSLYNDFATGDHCIRFKREETDEWIYLTEVHGRVIPLDIDNARQVLDFLKQ